MVLVATSEVSAGAARLVKSVDLAVRDLLEVNVDPFALANYLWVIQKHNVSLVNGDRLSDWARAWVRRILIENHVGRRADEEISAAALAVGSLAHSGQITNRHEVVEGLRRQFNRSTLRATVPFDNPAYAAGLLVGAVRCGFDDSSIRRAIGRVRDVFEMSLPHGRLFGVAYVAELLNTLDIEHRHAFWDRLSSELTNAGLGYEDQVYVAQGLCHLALSPGKARTSDDVSMDEIELVVSRAPIWPYLMSGLEEVEPAGDSRIPIIVSHLYRAALLDVVLTLSHDAAQRQETQLDAKLRGRTATGAFALIGIVVSLSLPWLLLGTLLFPWIEVGRRYWLQKNYNVMDPSSALLLLGGVLIGFFFAIWTPSVLVSLYQLLVRSAVESDQRAAAAVWKDTKRALAIWATLAFALVGLLNEPLLHTLGRL